MRRGDEGDQRFVSGQRRRRHSGAVEPALPTEQIADRAVCPGGRRNLRDPGDGRRLVALQRSIESQRPPGDRCSTRLRGRDERLGSPREIGIDGEGERRAGSRDRLAQGGFQRPLVRERAGSRERQGRGEGERQQAHSPRLLESRRCARFCRIRTGRRRGRFADACGRVLV